MGFLDKIKDLFSDEEEVIETKEIEVEEREEHKLPTFMRNKIEEEQKREEEKKIKEENIDIISDREVVRSKNGNNFSFPMDIDDSDVMVDGRYNTGNKSSSNFKDYGDYSDYDTSYSRQNVLLKEQEKKDKSLSSLYAKKEEPKPKKFKPTPVISPVYGVLDKNYTKDEVKIQDESTYELQRQPKKVDFQSVRNKAFGSLTDDIRNNLCENCELYQEVKITKNADFKNKSDDINLLADITDDVSLGDAEDNYFDFGVSYEVPKKEGTTVINADKVEVELEINNEIKIVNHNDEESGVEKIEVKETVLNNTREEKLDKLLEDTKEFEKISYDEESIESILGTSDDIPVSDTPLDDECNDIFNLIDSMYDEEGK